MEDVREHEALSAFFSVLAERAYRENDLSDVTYAMPSWKRIGHSDSFSWTSSFRMKGLRERRLSLSVNTS